MHWKSVVCLICFAAALRAQVPWSAYAHDPQHTGLSAFAAEPLQRVKWSTPVDVVLANTPGELLIHYGSPLITAANTVIVPVRADSSDNFRVEAHSGADGTLLYTLGTDYSLPPHNWTPSYSPVLTPANRLYYAGAGGTVYYRDQPDSVTGASGQIAFYGNALYFANQAAFNSKVRISTPIVSDLSGNIFFGFVVLGANPASLVSGIARIDANGTGSWLGAASASSDVTMLQVPLNCTPALSNDGSTLYFAVSQGGTSPGYLVSVDSHTLAPIAHIRLKDPEFATDAQLIDDGSASPTVGPDGDVYYGVFEHSCCTNNDRGWLLHFDQGLTQTKIPGAFGWDTTASIVPAALVPSYHGASSYLLLTKYNNYDGVGTGNGHNRVAVLDPNATETDPITGTTVMQEVITILGVTLDPPGNTTGAVKEWCINSAAIDAVNKSAIVNSEDGVVYRWDFTTNSFTQSLRLTPGVGEAYTPTAIGPDGTAYAINDGVLFAVAAAPALSIVKSHSGSFTEGQQNATYSVGVSNALGAGATSGTLTVTENVPSGLSLVSMSGGGWSCPPNGNTCTRNDPLAPGGSYPAITVTANVSPTAGSPLVNSVTLSLSGLDPLTGYDPTTIIQNPPVLSISKTHTGNFAQGQFNDTYTVTVSNASAAGPTSGTVTVTENVPSGLTLVSMSGNGWTCPPNGNTCTRGDPLMPGLSYPLTVMVNVSPTAASPQVNGVSVLGGGAATANATDPTTILPSRNLPLHFIPVVPCRIMDTRDAGYPSGFGPPSLLGGAARDIAIPSSGCQIPAGAQAYSLNFTVIPKSTTLYYLTAWPTGQPQPFVSTLNSPDASVIANAAIVPAGAGGSISVAVTQATDLVIDINGYFGRPPRATLHLILPPCRILDTRNAPGTFGGPSLAANTERSFPVLSSACGVPSTAQAYALNVTAVPKGALFYITTWPTGQPKPLVSTLNSYDGTVLANMAIVPAGSSGAVSFFPSNDTDLVVDINGYFAPPAAGGLSFFAIAPCRIADTRNPTGTFGGPNLGAAETRAFPVPQASCGLPSTAGAYSLNVTAVPVSFLAYLTVWPAGTGAPLVSTLNGYKGIAIANAAIIPAGTSGSVNVFAHDATAVVIDTNGYFAQ